MSKIFDVAIVGAGMAGASIAYFLSSRTRAVLLETESAPGYHTTGRSAAFYSETYGGPVIQPLSTASKPFFDAPPPGFTERPLLCSRGCLHIAHADAADALADIESVFAGTGVRLERVTASARASMLRPDWAGTALWEPDCRDMDVGEIHRGFLAGARNNGAVLMVDADVTAIGHTPGGAWRLTTRAGAIEAGIVVNAAGAWADVVAAMAGAVPLGIAPLRRTMAQVIASPTIPRDLPLVIDAAGSFYFKPEVGRLWISPHDEVPDQAGDCQPDQLDVATAIDRFESATTARIIKLDRAWAGLRCFAPDRAPVYGWDIAVPGFFWCAGQGGFGIQTAPAAGIMAAALLEGRHEPDTLGGVNVARYSPNRFRPDATGTRPVR